jgi:hypothetical protein
MGLTIHYHLSTRNEWSEETVLEWLGIVADYARHLGCANVGPVLPARNFRLSSIAASDDLATFPSLDNVTDILHQAGRGTKKRFVPISPDKGSAVAIDIGAGCQWFVLALCKYPAQWLCRHGSHMRRWYSTHISQEWQFSWFCKTQFAGQHGAAHFLRCHKTVVSLLDFCQKSGVEVGVRDEARYWENRDETKLAASLHQSEALLAAFAGLLKDAVETKGGYTVESSAFDYASFEHLEQEGWERFGSHLEALRKCAMSATA